MILEIMASKRMIERIGLRFGLVLWAFRAVGVTLCLVAMGCLAGCGGGSGYSSPPPPPPPTSNPVPTISSLNPNTIVAFVPIFGEPPVTIAVTGTNFITGANNNSSVLWNGSPLPTLPGPSGGLLAELGSSNVSTPDTATITVFNGPPGGGTSNALTFTVLSPPAITALSPSSVIAGGPAFTLTVTGTGFFPSSTVQWNPSGTASGTNARPTTFVSSTQVQAAISAADITVAGIAQVQVFGPTALGGASSTAAFAINNPVPTAASLTPNSTIAGGPGFTLTVTGTNFVPTSTIQWNGSARTTTFVSSTSLFTSIPAADISTGGTAQVSVLTPGPGGGTSNSVSFPVVGPVISLLNPSSAVAGGPMFPLAVTGANFVPTSVVKFNGMALNTAFVSSTQINAQVPATDIPTVGTASITVANPVSSGGVSLPATFFIGSAGGANFAAITVNQATKDIVYDATNRLFYLSVPGTDAVHPNTFAVLNPLAGTIASWQQTGINPNVLAVSDDSQFLYVGIDGAVQRFSLPRLVSDINYSLPVDSFGGGPFIALDLQVAPGTPHTTAVTLGVTTSTPSAQGGVAIFDDGTARPTIAKGFGPGGGGGVLYDSLQWGSDATALFAANNEDTGFDFYTLSVNVSGVVQTKDYPNAFSSFFNRIHFDPGTKFVYADDGHIVDPSTGNSAGKFNASGPMVPDSILNKAFFLTSGGSSNVTIPSI